MIPEEKAIELLVSYGQIDGSHHQAWCIDQTLRLLMGAERYREMRAASERDGYDHNEGIAP